MGFPVSVVGIMLFLAVLISISVPYPFEYNNGILVNLVAQEHKPVQEIHFSQALILIFTVHLFKKS